MRLCRPQLYRSSKVLVAILVSHVFTSSAFLLYPGTDGHHLGGQSFGFSTKNAQQWLQSPEGRSKLGKCLPQESIPTQNKNFTDKELEVLPSICWRRDLLETKGLRQQNMTGRIPAGVKCKVTLW